MDTKLESVTINRYRQYRHNGYDGYCCSWGVLMALGGDGTADCFCSGEHTDIDKNFRNPNGCDLKILLQNLDHFPFDQLDDDNIVEIKHTEYWGNSPIPVIYNKIDKTVTVLGKTFLVTKIYR